MSNINNHRIQKFDLDGKCITKLGSKGNGPSQFHSPDGIDVDTAGNVYIVDTGDSRIQTFSVDGKCITKWG